jgi:hypothetical protein
VWRVVGPLRKLINGPNYVPAGLLESFDEGTADVSVCVEREATGI